MRQLPAGTEPADRGLKPETLGQSNYFLLFSCSCQIFCHVGESCLAHVRRSCYGQEDSVVHLPSLGHWVARVLTEQSTGRHVPVQRGPGFPSQVNPDGRPQTNSSFKLCGAGTCVWQASAESGEGPPPAGADTEHLLSSRPPGCSRVPFPSTGLEPKADDVPSFPAVPRGSAPLQSLG